MFKTPRFTLWFLACGFASALISTNAIAAAGDLYVVKSNEDTSGYSIVRFARDGTPTTFASGLEGPGPLAFDHEGNLFAGNVITGEVAKISPDGTKTLFATGLDRPAGLCFDAAGNLYVANTGWGRITDPDPSDGSVVKITPAGIQSVFASSLNRPASLAFDRFGNLFVTDTLFHTIIKITPEGLKNTFASGLDQPAVIAFNASGDLYETDAGSGNVFKFGADGTRTTLASGYTSPAALAVDETGNVFVGDAYINIYKIRPDGTSSTFLPGFNGSMAVEPARGRALNISSRLQVLGGDSAPIAGFILTGPEPKRVMIRGIGPSLTGIQGTLTDPTLELRDSAGTLIASNDNWKVADGTQVSQQAAMEATTIAPLHDLEPAIVATLPANNSGYTAMLRGKNNMTGIALVEVYDLEQPGNSRLANISTRGMVEAHAPLIGGFILGSNGAAVLVRAIGPSLREAGLESTLADPRVDLYNSNGIIIASNDDWKATQRSEIEASFLAPGNDSEAAIMMVLPSGAYTAVVMGSGPGLALVEVYHFE